jgi:hypothetical protein
LNHEESGPHAEKSSIPAAELVSSKKPFSSVFVEGFNTKAKLTTRKAYGFKTYHAAEIALYHALEALHVPKTTYELF